jgi:hypothetical protein
MRYSITIILAVVVVFFGIMVLSHISINVMAHGKVKIESVANMTSCESNNPNVIKVDGICFKTLVPETIVLIPKYGEEALIKFGVRITNQTSTPYRFDLPFILPEMLNPDGEPMQSSGGQNATRLAEESDIPLIISGESLDFLMDAKLDWYSENYLRLQGNAYYGGIWVFWCPKPGKYQIRFIYQNQLASKKKFTSKEGRTEIDAFWVGKIQTPFVDLHLR